MPYIKQPDRYELDHGRLPRTPGELNYYITSVVNKYVEWHGLSYPKINDVLGALEGAKLEFYRRVAVPYEDEKIVVNGDVYHRLNDDLAGIVAKGILEDVLS